MITISDEAKALLQGHYRQIIRIEFANGADTIRLTEADIVQGSFRWDRYCATGDVLEIGSAIAAEIEFTLLNDKGCFLTDGGSQVPTSAITFEGKELSVYVGISKWDARRWENAQIIWFPIGKFMVMTPPHKFSTIHISALDRMIRFDVHVPTEIGENPFSSSETLHSMVQKLCAAVGLTYTFPSTLPNYDLTVDIDELFEEAPELTYRMLVQWIAALTGSCAYIDVDGKLVFRWLERAAGVTVTPNMRYSSTVYEPVGFVGLAVEKNDEILELGSDSGCRFGILDNALIQGEGWADTYSSALSDVWSKLSDGTIVYRPFEASVVPLPYLEPLDIISYKDNNGATFDTIITNITFTLNGAVGISAVGVSQTEAQYVSPGGRTSRESADISALKNRIALLENATAAARDRLSDFMRMALGLHVIAVTAPDGGLIYYFTTASVPDTGATLADLSAEVKPNDVIYTLSGAGWVWCLGKDWDKTAHHPVDNQWKYGITRDGSAVLGLVNTAGITVADVDTAYRTEITPESFSVYNGSSFVFGFDGRLESRINRLLVKSNIGDTSPNSENNAYIRLGSAMLIPASGGLDIVYVEDI